MIDNTDLKTGKKVLIIEDDPMLRSLITKKIANEGFSVSFGVDHQTAFIEIGKDVPDIILLDLILPDMDGFGILEKIKADKRTVNVPVLILSNLGQAEDIKRVMELGAHDFLVKANFTLDEIVDRVKKVF